MQKKIRTISELSNSLTYEAGILEGFSNYLNDN